MPRALPIALAALLVLAGCAAPTSPTTGTSVGEGTASTASETPTASPTPTSTVDSDNPYRERTLTVAVTNAANDSRSFLPQVRQALDYWEANSEQYAGYPIQYELQPNASDPDVVVRFVDTVENCGNESHAVGCAPRIESAGQVDRPVTVRIAGGYADHSTVAILKHELGHTLGLSHEDEPQTVMASHSNLETLPQPNATERALPWNTSDLRVYVDWGPIPESERDTRKSQINHALDYYADGAEGTVPENVSFSYVQDPERAHVVIRFSETLPCGEAPGSCGAARGLDPDGDGALETYSRLNITLAGIDPDATGWHVGYWLGYGFGFDEESDYPPPFRDASPSERRSDWWN